jgi:hypothetical protein
VRAQLKLTQYNVVNGVAQYLAVGLVPLPAVYGVLAGVYLVLLLAWILLFLRARGAKVNRVHHLMSGLLLLKMLSLAFHTLDLHFTMANGEAGGWALIYYLLTAAKTMMMFLLIALIGTGWSFVKPFLSSSDKQILLVVLPLQVLDNIALLIIEESAPGSSYFVSIVARFLSFHTRALSLSHTLSIANNTYIHIDKLERCVSYCRHSVLRCHSHSNHLVDQTFASKHYSHKARAHNHAYNARSPTTLQRIIRKRHKSTAKRRATCANYRYSVASISRSSATSTLLASLSISSMPPCRNYFHCCL